MCKVIICGLILFLCCSELNPNLWTSEDVITQEPTCYDNSDEQVSTFSTSKEAALGRQAFQLYDSKVNGQQGYWSSAEVHLTRPYQGGTQCHVKDDCSQTFQLKQLGCEEQGQSPEILESSISIRDFCLNLSESDQAETDFINFKSSNEENTNARVYDDGYPENMLFIDDVPSVEPTITTTNNSLMKQFKSQVPSDLPHSLTTSSPAHMACDSPITLDYECAEFFLEDDFHDRGPSSPDSLNGYGCLDTDCRPFSPESESSQCSFSFLELFFSQPIRAQLMSQYCDYFLLYSGGKPSSRNSTNAPSHFNERLGEKSIYTQSVEKAPLFTSDVSTAKNRTHYKKSIHKEEKQKSVLSSGHCHQVRLVSPEPLKPASQSFLDYWFSDLNQSSIYVPSPGKLEKTLMNVRQSSSEEKDSRNSCSGYKSLISNETCYIFELPKPVVFELVKRPKYILEFPNKNFRTTDKCNFPTTK